ncbi:MAG: thioester reductase-like protein [Bradymonadia bacterium]|jgi:thioester reductase-like protein
MIFLTGSTGYIGSYVATGLLREHSEDLLVFVRAKDAKHAEERLWKAWQLHMDFDEYMEFVRTRVHFVLGDLTAINLGLSDEVWNDTAKKMTSVIHVAASLNRKSAKACFNVNLRGTLSIVRLARQAHDDHGLRRFSDVSTVAVCGHRNNEMVDEEHIIEWDRSDYDPYARTKKFCEHMVHELLPDVDCRVFRPSTVLGDSRFPETVQFDMVRAFVMLSKMRVLPLSSQWRMDIVPANYVAAAIVKIHQLESPKYSSYNLSAGASSLTYAKIVDAMQESGHPGKRPKFVPALEGPFTKTVNALSNSPRKFGVAYPASLLKVFMPYLVNNTVFDNTRVVEEMGQAPEPFSDYAFELFNFATTNDFEYPYEPWPAGVEAGER